MTGAPDMRDCRAVMELNHVLLFIAGISPLLVLVRTLRRPRQLAGWTGAALLVLATVAASWFFARPVAGYISGTAWFLFLLCPAIGMRKLESLALEQRHRFARRLAQWLRLVHPADGVPEQARLFAILENAPAGPAAAADRLATLFPDDATPVARLAAAHRFSLRGDWIGFLQWFQQGLERGDREAHLLPFFLRALGETGQQDELVMQHAAQTGLLSRSAEGEKLRAICELIVLTFTGEHDLAQRLLATRLSRLPASARQFWTGDSGRRSPEEPLSSGARRVIERIKTGSPAWERPAARFFPRLSLVVLVFGLLNVAMFLVELRLGGSTNPATLHRLGQLEPFSVVYRQEYWRLLSSTFLHYGPLHLFFNLYGLILLGPGLERAVGRWRFAAIYLLGGLGSGLGVVFARLQNWTAAEQVVGASGSVMALVGAWAGYLIMNRHAPQARRRLRNVILIVVIQTAFDLSTPQISMAAHLSGLAAGLLLGLFLSPKSSTSRAA